MLFTCDLRVSPCFECHWSGNWCLIGTVIITVHIPLFQFSAAVVAASKCIQQIDVVRLVWLEPPAVAKVRVVANIFKMPQTEK